LALLEVTDLKVHFETDDGIVQAVDGVSYTVDRGQALGIVGESGSGKSVSSLTVMGLTRFAGNARISGSIKFDGTDLLGVSDEEMRTLRGNEVAMIFQDPLSSLHPFYKIGDQLVEAVQAHRDVSKAQSGRDARPGRSPRAAPARGLLSARVLWRHAPARDDRHGAHQRPQAADRRRAHDRARRDRAGADPRPPSAPAA
jgi:ABC-type dipeptide/oligopeptide/nickel transport system ATPase component